MNSHKTCLSINIKNNRPINKWCMHPYTELFSEFLKSIIKKFVMTIFNSSTHLYFIIVISFYDDG